MVATTPKLFTPAQVGDVALQHRLVMCPLTRNRATEAHIPTDLMVEYYAQRGSTPGTLLITEATFISPQAGGYEHVPGIWNDEQVAEWKRVTDAVHEQGSFIYCQLWALGRTADPSVLETEGPYPFVSSTDIKLQNSSKTPRPVTIEEINEYVQWYTNAAKNAIRAGFDGVEIHGANGYFLDQFIQDVCNKRTDEYGGSIENRTRFPLEVIDSISAAIGASKTGIRLSPWGFFNDMRMADPKPSFGYLVSEIVKRHPDFAYIHLVEPRVNGNEAREVQEGEENDFLRKIWAPKPFISAGGYTADLAVEIAEAKDDLIAVGRYFISNPDLPVRWQKGLPAVMGDRTKYYLYESPDGYVDYPFADGSVRPSKYKPKPRN